MAQHGKKIAEVSPTELKARLAEASSPKAVKRLVAAREYLAGSSPSEIEAKYGFPEQTVYEWLDRIEDRGLEAALEDESPPGRPLTLEAAQREQFERAVGNSPRDVGFDRTTWTPALAQTYLSREFDVEDRKSVV